MQKTRKHFDGEQEKSMASIDRLPDDIVVHILSLMSTRRCVQSSILGKRWRFLWARVPNLKLDSRDHKTLTSFSNFFNRFVFTHKGQNIHTFSITFVVDSEYKFEIEKLIATAIACNVQVIEIWSDFGLMLPQSILTSKTLADLSLVGLYHNNVPMDPMTGTTVYLPALKKLELIWIRYESEKSLEHLLSGCPALEELTIFKKDNNVVCVYVSSPTLTRLDLKIGFDNVKDKGFEVKLDTPALEYLELHDYLSEDFSAGTLASLTEADVVFDAHTTRDVLLYSRSVLEFVGKLNNVSCLRLENNWNYMEVPDSAFSALTTKFRNLTELELAGDRRFVTNFLENSDNLQVLTINMVDNLQYWMEPKQLPVCLIYHLGTVWFFKFKCSEPEFNMVEYILRNAKVLKRMEIRISYYSEYLKKKPEALKRISLFERASEACQLAFE